MKINIPLSTELLTWWIKNAKYEDYTLNAPLPIRLDFDGQSIDLGKAGVKLKYDYNGVASVTGRVGVSSDNPKAQARMLGLEYLRDSVSFELTEDETKMILLMSETAQMMAERAATATNDDEMYINLFNNTLDDN